MSSSPLIRENERMPETVIFSHPLVLTMMAPGSMCPFYPAQTVAVDATGCYWMLLDATGCY